MSIIHYQLSIVSPVYQAEKIIDELVRRITREVEKITSDYEIILVEDGSRDNSWAKIEAYCAGNPKVKGIKLSRNFGQHYAISAGLSYARGEWVVVMDCDLQDRPENIPLLYEKALEGYDVVVGRKKERKDSLQRKLESAIYFWMLEKATGIKIPRRIGNFGIYRKKVIESFYLMKETNRNFGLFIIWLGFNRIEIDIESDERFEGNSSYSFFKKWRLGLDTITSFSDRVLQMVISLGIIIVTIAVLLLIIHIINVYRTAEPLAGWTSLILSIYLSLGLILCCLGVVGLYIGKIFGHVKNRPPFVVSETLNNDKN